MSKSLAHQELSNSLPRQESTQLGEQAEAEIQSDGSESDLITTGASQIFKNLFSIPGAKEAVENESREKTWELRYFNAFMIVMTLASIVQLGFEVDYPEWRTTWLIAENYFTSVFVLELAIRLYVFKGKYFRDKANWLDGFLAIVGVLNVWILGPILGVNSIENSQLRTTSTFRVLRFLRLIKFLRIMRIRMLAVVLASLAQATKAATSVFLVLTIMVYAFALFLTQSLGKEDTGLYPGFSSEWATDVESPLWQLLIGDFNPYIYFGSIPSSMYTLFNMASFTEWQEVVRPIAVKQPEFVPVFLFFALVVGFGIMNVLVAVIVEAVLAESHNVDEEQKARRREQKVKALEKIEEILASTDTDGDGTIHLAELNQVMNESKEFQELLKDIDFPRGWSSSEMLSMLDSSGYGRIDVSKFSKSLFRLLYGSDFQQMCIMQASINRVKAMLVDQNEFSIKMFTILQDDMAAIKAAVGTAGVRQASQTQPGDNIEAQRDIPIAAGFGHQSAGIENDLMLRMQMTVKECIRQEFLLSNPSRSNSPPGISSLERDRGTFDHLPAVPSLQNMPTEAEWCATAAKSEAQQLQAYLKECTRRMENLLDQVHDLELEKRSAVESARSAVREPGSAVPPREDTTQSARERAREAVRPPREETARSARERAREALRAHKVLCQQSNADKEQLQYYGI